MCAVDRQEGQAAKEGAAMNCWKAEGRHAGQIDVGGDLRVNRLGFGAMRIIGSGIWGDPTDRSGRSPWRP